MSTPSKSLAGGDVATTNTVIERSAAVKKVTRTSGQPPSFNKGAPATQPLYEASAVDAMSGSSSFLALSSLYPLGVGAGVALLATVLIYVIKVLLTRYTKN